MVFCLEFPGAAQRQNNLRIGFSMAASPVCVNNERANTSLQEFKMGLENLYESGWSFDCIVFQNLQACCLRLCDTDVFDQILPDARKKNVLRLQLSAGSREIAEIFGGFDMIVGMRFHSLVLAALCGIPFVGVGDDHKLRDICAIYGMPYLTLSGLRASSLVASVNIAQGLKPSESVTRSLSRLAEKNFENLENCLA
jgi:polysaccharide pyruvyl transferase WcaK-like protein